MTKKYWLIKSVFASAILTLAFQNVWADEPLREKKIADAGKKVLTLIEPDQQHDLNPRTSNYVSDAQILNGLYEGLFSYDPQNLDPLPAICVNYKISRDKKRWTFTLRENACFSNGSKITAEDVRRSWLELLATKGAPYSSMLDVIEGAYEYRTHTGSADKVAITVISDTSLSIRLKTPVSYLPKLLCHSAFSVTHRNPTVYSGPFVIDEQKQGEMILRKNNFYWDAANVQLEAICVFSSLGSEENAFMFNTGFAEWVSSYDINTAKLINKNSIQINAQFGTEYLFFKTTAKKPNAKKSSPLWDKEEFRLAVLEAMPWDALREGSLVKATTLVYPLSGYPQVDGFSYTDTTEAKMMMDEARRKNKIPQDQIIPLHLKISENGLTEAQIKAITENMKILGVDFSVEFLPFVAYMNSISTCDADLVSYNWIGDFADPLAFLELFHGDATLNESGWENSEYDALIEKSSGCDGQERYNLLAEAEKLLLASGMVLPLSHPVSLTVIDLDTVGGWYPNAFNIHPLKYLYKKDFKPKIPNIVMDR